MQEERAGREGVRVTKEDACACPYIHNSERGGGRDSQVAAKILARSVR